MWWERWSDSRALLRSTESAKSAALHARPRRRKFEGVASSTRQARPQWPRLRPRWVCVWRRLPWPGLDLQRSTACFQTPNTRLFARTIHGLTQTRRGQFSPPEAAVHACPRSPADLHASLRHSAARLATCRRICDSVHSSRGALTDPSNRSTPTRSCRAPPRPPDADRCAARLAPAPMPIARPAGAPLTSVQRCGSRLQTEVGAARSSQMSMRSMKLSKTRSRPSTAPTLAQYPSSMGTMLRSSFCARVDAQRGTCRSVVCASHQKSR